MADFKTRIEDLVGHTVGSETSQYLKDGVLDVTNRVIALRPLDAELFMKSSQESTSQGGLDSHSGRIISVLRESGTDGDWRPCRKIPISLQSRVTDKSSLEYASAYSPAFTQSDDGVISVYPAPSGTSGNKYKIYHVNGSPVNTSNAGLVNTHTDIKYFPESMVHYVVLYASIKVLDDMIASLSFNLSATHTIGSIPDIPIAPTMSTVSATLGGTPPLYNAPVLTLTSLVQGNLSISASPPTAPDIEDAIMFLPETGLPTYTSPTKPVVQIPTTPVIGDLVIPNTAHVPPTLNVSDTDILSKFEAISDPSFVPPAKPDLNWTDANTWINDEEDIEMVQARMMEIDGKIKNYQAELQDATAEFSKNQAILQKEIQKVLEVSQTAQAKDTAEIQLYSEKIKDYGTEIQKAVQEKQANDQKTIGLWQAELENKLREYGEDLKLYSASLQDELNKFNQEVTIYQGEVQKATADAQMLSEKQVYKIQKYQGEISVYQANIQKEVEEYKQNFEADFKIWQTENTNNLQKYSADIQNALNDFNKENTEYSAEVQKDLANSQLADAKEQREAQLFAAEVQGYSSKVQALVQKSSIEVDNTTKEIANYAALRDRFSGEYDKFFQISAPQQAPQQRQRRR